MIPKIGFRAAAALLAGAFFGVFVCASGLAASPGGGTNHAGQAPTAVVSLDGQWLLATDPQNVGSKRKWFVAPVPEAKPTRVPWIIQEAFPGYHGVAWYWRGFTAPANPHPQGRYLLRFWAVDYKADVWLNGVPVGGHEGGETPFVLDVTGAVKPQANNRLAVRVLNPTHEPIDGIVLNETPHRNKALPYRAGSAWDQGGIIDSVELLAAPPVRVEDLFARPDRKTGAIRVQANIRNAGTQAVMGQLEFTAAPAASGETAAVTHLKRELKPGDTLVETKLQIEHPHLWDLNDPYLYRVTARVRTESAQAFDEHSVRCGFRDFRFENGYFRLNGRRVFLRCSHTGNCCPVGLELPHDPDVLRRDLIYVKTMGFNAIRFIAGMAKRYQLDLCDEIGLLVYEEPYAAWCMQYSAKFAERYDRSFAEMIRRDRNHPSVVIWGLLNETPDGPVFRHAVGMLKLIRPLDDSRMVMLNSGRWDAQGGDVAGIEIWRNKERTDPCVTYNGTKRIIKALGITWATGQLAFHPGRNGEYAVVRWTAPEQDKVGLSATFTSIAEKATTDVHVLHNDRSLFESFINLKDRGPESRFSTTVTVKSGDTIDCVVGFGNGDYGADTTALAVAIKSSTGGTHDAAANFSAKQNPNGVWSYGWLAPGQKPNTATFARYPMGMAERSIGSLSNPESTCWEDVLDDQHCYPRVPHTAGIIRSLRDYRGGKNSVGVPEQGLAFPPTPDESVKPVFLSEYGIGSAVDLVRVVGHYERLGKADVEDARFYRNLRDRFLADWKRWRLDETFASPEDYFAQCLAKMAGQRLLGLNAIRSNPVFVGYSVTGTVDQGMTGEGLFTTFRELKPGTIDAMFDGFAPLRWCLFVEPINVYRKARVRLEAVLADEDALSAGEYPVHLQVVGPNTARIFERTITVKIPESKGELERPLALPVFAEDLVVDGPSGKYRFLATFAKGAAAAGGEAEFYVTDPAEMPPVEGKIALWGQDDELIKWLAGRGVKVGQLDPNTPTTKEVILVSTRPAPPGDAEAFGRLTRRIEQGATAVFLSPDVFRKGNDADGWLPLKEKVRLGAIGGWLYLKDEWAKSHPIFEGLPSGGLMDYTFYREIIPDQLWVGQEPPDEAVAGAMKTSQDYASGLTVCVYRLGKGRLILNTLRIRGNLGTHPAAERLLRNLLRYAGRVQTKQTQ